MHSKRDGMGWDGLGNTALLINDDGEYTSRSIYLQTGMVGLNKRTNETKRIED